MSYVKKKDIIRRYETGPFIKLRKSPILVKEIACEFISTSEQVRALDSTNKDAEKLEISDKDIAFVCTRDLSTARVIRMVNGKSESYMRNQVSGKLLSTDKSFVIWWKEGESSLGDFAFEKGKCYRVQYTGNINNGNGLMNSAQLLHYSQITSVTQLIMSLDKNSNE